MSLPVFLVEAGSLGVTGATVAVGGEEGRHAAVVRRIAVGEQVELVDGRGELARCVVVDSSREGLTCRVVERRSAPPPRPRLVVVQALPKGDRGELAVEVLTEVGVDEVVPWEAARCVTRWRGERAARALRRWRTSAYAAAKQSRRSRWPVVADLASTADVAARVAGADLALVLDEGAETSLAAYDPPADGQVLLVVGPEGGLAPEEVETLVVAGARTARLGPTVLRTSTAGVVAAGVVLARTPRWAP